MISKIYDYFVDWGNRVHEAENHSFLKILWFWIVAVNLTGAFVLGTVLLILSGGYLLAQLIGAWIVAPIVFMIVAFAIALAVWFEI